MYQGKIDFSVKSKDIDEDARLILSSFSIVFTDEAFFETAALTINSEYIGVAMILRGLMLYLILAFVIVF